MVVVPPTDMYQMFNFFSISSNIRQVGNFGTLTI